jgi:hypothetical protein
VELFVGVAIETAMSYRTTQLRRRFGHVLSNVAVLYRASKRSTMTIRRDAADMGGPGQGRHVPHLHNALAQRRRNRGLLSSDRSCIS